MKHHPREPLGHVNLANLLMYEDELGLARAHYEIALELDPGNVHAHQRFSELLHQTGDLKAMRRHRRLGFAGDPVRSFPFLGDGEPIPLLLLTSTPAGDVAWPKLIDTRVFAVTTLVAEFHPPSAPLPAHQLVFNAIGDADLSNPDLLSAARLLAGSSAPVINPPAKVMATARAANAARLGALPGVVTPKMVTLPRAAFGGHDIGTLLGGLDLAFPLLLRSPGFHTGQHFLRVDRSDDLAAAAQSLPGDALMVIEFLETRGDDGLARKYRVMMIGGRLYPLHLAISTDWKVHYATAAMSDQPAFQAEEARFLEQMPDVLGERAMAALGAIEGGVGPRLRRRGFRARAPRSELVVFEANAVMNIIPPDASPQWDYRRAAVDRALGAARALLVERSASSVAADA